MQDKDKPIVTGTITNPETGEQSQFQHYLFDGGFALTTFAQVIEVEAFDHEDGTFQIAVGCLALDYIGNVFELNLDFTPGTVEEKVAILSDLRVDRVLFLKGSYSLVQEGVGVTLHDPMYSRIPPDYSETEIREVIEFNRKQFLQKVEGGESVTINCQIRGSLG